MANIFLVEDNPSDVELFRMALRESCVKCVLTVFEDGSEVIDYIRQADPSIQQSMPDLIILDLNLPKNDGLEILQIIRNTPRYAEVPIAVLSSSSSARERARLETFQIRQFITKPADLDEYLRIGRTVRDLLDEAESRGRGAATTVGG